MTRMMRLSDESLVEADDILQELFATLDGQGVGATGPESLQDAMIRSASIDMRYEGQEHSLTVPVELSDGHVTLDAPLLRECFDRAYSRTFGIVMEEPAELVTMRATVRTPLPYRDEVYVPARTLDPDAPETMSAFSFTRATRTPFRLLDRADIAVGSEIAGPALIVEPTATTYLDAGFAARLDKSGCLFAEAAG